MSLTCVVMIHDAAVQRRMPDNGIHNSEEVIFQHLCQYINISVQSPGELYGDSEPGAFNQRAAVNVSLRLTYLTIDPT